MDQKVDQKQNNIPDSRFLDDYPDVLRPEELMTILSVRRNTVYSLLKSGELKSVKIGKQYRIPKAYIENYINYVNS